MLQQVSTYFLTLQYKINVLIKINFDKDLLLN